MGAKNEELKPEWGTPEGRVMYKEPCKRPVMLASFTPAKGWPIFESALQAAVGNPEATPVALLANMKQW